MLNHNHDYIEGLRRFWYPKLHPYLERFGGFGVGTVYENQYVATIPAGEETFEEIISDGKWERNPIAAYKIHNDGRKSEGSWRLRAVDDEYNLLQNDSQQLHITLFNSEVEGHVDVYCHQEYDWTVSPLKHLREVEFSAEDGQAKCLEYLRDHTYLEWYDKNER